MGKRGPKPRGERKVVYYRRVTPEVKEALERVRLGVVAASAQVGDQGAGNAKETANAGQIAALLNDVEALTKDRDYWKTRFEKAVVATEHQLAVYWKDRALKAEKRAAELENYG